MGLHEDGDSIDEAEKQCKSTFKGEMVKTALDILRHGLWEIVVKLISLHECEEENHPLLSGNWSSTQP